MTHLSPEIPRPRTKAGRASSSPAWQRAAIRRTLVVSVIEGAFTSVFQTWTAGAVLTGYMIYLGAGPMELALVASVPLLAQVATPLAAWIEGMAPRRKTLAVVTAVVGRGVWIIAPLVPLLSLPKSFSPPILLVALVAFSSVFQSCTGTVWTAWMGEVVPENRRGRYFGLRNGLIGIVVLAANLTAGWFLDTFTPPGNYQKVLFLALLFASVGIYLYTRQYDPPSHSRRLSLVETFTVPLRDSNFRRFLIFGIYWQASIFLAAPFVYPYLLSHLKLTYSQIALWASIASVLCFVFGPLWGRLADRVGNKSILAMTTFMAGSLTPITWMMATPGRPGFIYLNGVLDALTWSALTPAMLNLGLATAPRQNRTAFLSVLGLATGLAGFLSGTFSGVLLGFLRHFEFTISSYRWTAFHSLFVLSMAFRLNAWRLIRPIHETNAWRTRDVLRSILQLRLSWFPW